MSTRPGRRDPQPPAARRDGRDAEIAALAARLAAAEEQLAAARAGVAAARRGDDALRESQARLATLANDSPVLLWVNGPDGCEFVNRAYLEFVGAGSETEVTRFDWSVFVHPDDRAGYLDAYRRAAAAAAPFVAECRFRRRDGDYRWIRSLASPHAGDDGRLLYVGASLDITEERATAAALAASEDRFRRATDSARALVYDVDLTGARPPHVHGLSTVLGLEPPAGELANGWWQERIHPDDLPPHRAAFAARLAAGGDWRAVYRIRHADGSWRHVEDTAEILRDDAGRPARLVGAVVDVTERRRHEEARELLLHEVNHRAKNLLAVVLAVARQTAATTPPERFARDLAERLQGLAASQDLMIRGDWRSVPLADLVRSQLHPLVLGADHRFEVAGPAVELRPAAAQGIGMALHELATNALKYGAWSNATGGVRIAWELAGDGDGARLRLEWRESGGPPVRPPKRAGFGSTVITRLAAAAVHGDVDLDWAPNGVRWRLEAPAARVLTSAGADGRAAAEADRRP